MSAGNDKVVKVKSFPAAVVSNLNSTLSDLKDTIQQTTHVVATRTDT